MDGILQGALAQFSAPKHCRGGGKQGNYTNSTLCALPFPVPYSPSFRYLHETFAVNRTEDLPSSLQATVGRQDNLPPRRLGRRAERRA